jgi:hypothetical protein
MPIKQNLPNTTIFLRDLRGHSVKRFLAIIFIKGPEEVKWEMGLSYLFLAGKMGSVHAVGLTGIHEPKNNKKWEWD